VFFPAQVWDRHTGDAYGVLPIGHKGAHLGPRSMFHCATEKCWPVADHELVGSAGKVWTLKFHDAVMVSGSHDMTIRITRFDRKPTPLAAYAVKK
jgi:hypothetical protein